MTSESASAKPMDVLLDGEMGIRSEAEDFLLATLAKVATAAAAAAAVAVVAVVDVVEDDARL